MEYLIASAWYIGSCILIGVHSEKNGGSGWKYFIVSLIFSPIIASILLVSEFVKQKK